MKRGNKKGQFYLLAAIIIIVVISGFAAVSNYAKKRSSVKIYDISEELQIEGGEVLEYGVFYKGGENIKELIENFTTEYKAYAGEGKELFFIYGTEQDIYVFSFEESYVTSTYEGVETTTIHFELTEIPYTKTGRTVEVIINGNTYPFDLKPGQNFFFIISQEIEGEQHIVTG